MARRWISRSLARGTMRRGGLALALALLLAAPAIAAAPAPPGRSGADPAELGSPGAATARADPAAASAPPLYLNVSRLNSTRPAVDLGESFTAHAVVSPAPPGASFVWSWSGYPRGLVSTPNDTSSSSKLNGTPLKAGVYRIFVNVTYSGGTGALSKNLTLTVYPDMVVQVAAVPASGAAPLAVELVAYISGGDSPYSVRWSNGDESVGVGSNWSTTYSTPGVYAVSVNVTDATYVYDASIGQFTAALNVSVVSTRPHGPFGLPGLQGWALVGGLIAAILASILYGIRTRGRRRALPPAEPWMIAGTAGRAGGVSTERARPPAEPPSGGDAPGPGRPPGGPGSPL